ncbi:MAG: diacylglycerol kinase family protein [Planctomycetaceae bacterium]|nr:diacylglycerol kinase family protein [Planctomycetaceae bacterium]
MSSPEIPPRPSRQSFLKSVRNACAGILTAFRSERNFRIQSVIAIVVLLAGWRFEVSHWEWAVLVVAIGMVLTAELFNTAIEAVVDLASPEIHPLAKRAKDVAAGATLIAAITAAVLGLIVFLPHLSAH